MCGGAAYTESIKFPCSVGNRTFAWISAPQLVGKSPHSSGKLDTVGNNIYIFYMRSWLFRFNYISHLDIYIFLSLKLQLKQKFICSFHVWWRWSLSLWSLYAGALYLMRGNGQCDIIIHFVLLWHKIALWSKDSVTECAQCRERTPKNMPETESNLTKV